MTLAVNIAQGGSNNVTFRNRIINGDFRVSQYNGTASFTPSSGNYSIDRFLTIASLSAKFTGQQLSSSPPTGFSYYLGLTSSSAYSVPSGEIYAQIQRIEGLNVADLNWGSTNAKPVTLSFQVQSSLTGTFGGVIRSGQGNYGYPFTYTISSANTWTAISITIPGPTIGGTSEYPINNSTGLAVSFGIGVGSTYSATAGSWQSGNYYSATGATSVVGTNGATWYVTGVQLEAGTTASPFEYRQYGTELQLCQRYFVNTAQLAAMANTNSQYVSATSRLNPVPMRATPSVSMSGTYTFNPFFGASQYTSSNAPTLQRNVADNFIVNFNMGASTGTAGFGEVFNATLSISAEL